MTQDAGAAGTAANRGRPGDAPRARDDRTPEPSLLDRLYREPWRFEFAQAVRILERHSPDRARVGTHGVPHDEVARFRSHATLAFPASVIQDLAQPSEPGAPPELTVNFMGLAGPMGVLPTHYTALLSDPAYRKQTRALRDFLDLFNHRLVSLFYRAWERYRFPIAYERSGEDIFSWYLLCLLGMGTPALRNRLQISDHALIYYAGLLSKRPRAAVALEGLLADYFGVPVEVEQFTGQWFLMNPDALTQLGPPGQNTQLGVDATLWARVWDPQARFRVRIGPLTWKQFEHFLPDGEAYQRAVQLTRFFVGEEFNFEIQPVLHKDEVPGLELGARRARLGWAVWLKTVPFEQHAEHAVFEARSTVSQF